MTLPVDDDRVQGFCLRKGRLAGLVIFAVVGVCLGLMLPAPQAAGYRAGGLEEDLAGVGTVGFAPWGWDVGNEVVSSVVVSWHPMRAEAPAVAPRDRADSVRFYKEVYQASQGIGSGWTGAISGCVAGELDAAYREAIQLRVLYFRAMAGLGGEVVLDPALHPKCQLAALMMSANKDLRHDPPESWVCYSADGAEAASRSNLALGIAGPGAVDLFMEDPGDVNYFTGHRRWLLYPSLWRMGVGAVTPGANYPHAAALWVLFPPETRPPLPEWVAWPPHGYVPRQVVYPRWSFSYPKADFSSADVIMTRDGEPVGLSVSPLGPPGYADNTLVWMPQGLPSGPPSSDYRYEVAIRNVAIGGIYKIFEYTVVVIDPDRTMDAPVLEPTSTPTPTPAPTPLPEIQAVINAVTGRSVPSAVDDWNGDGAVDAADAVRAGVR